MMMKILIMKIMMLLSIMMINKIIDDYCDYSDHYDHENDDDCINGNIIHFFIGPQSDHWLCLSLTHFLTDSLTPV